MKRRVFVLLGILLLLICSIGACGFLKKPAKPEAKSCGWSLERQAAQVVVMPVDSSNVAAAAPAVTTGAGGVILFGKQAPGDLQAKLTELVNQAPDGRKPFVMSDEEGGSVQRLSNLVGKLNSARWMADHLSPAQIKQEASKMGERMKGLGVTMNLAPVLDLDNKATIPDKKDAIGNRSFNGDPAKAAQSGVAFMQGLQDAGVIPVVKHFPGLGGAVGGNTDFSQAHTVPWNQLHQTGLKPFKAAFDAGVPAVMTANATVPGLTDKPASISPEVTKVLREELGFKGLIMTDTLSAGAFSASGYTPEVAAVAALQAGADLLLFGGVANSSTEQFNKITAAIVAAVNDGHLSRETLTGAANAVLSAKRLEICGS
jgi:beta-N-acetylhexosaminidase